MRPAIALVCLVLLPACGGGPSPNLNDAHASATLVEPRLLMSRSGVVGDDGMIDVAEASRPGDLVVLVGRGEVEGTSRRLRSILTFDLTDSRLTQGVVDARLVIPALDRPNRHVGYPSHTMRMEAIYALDAFDHGSNNDGALFHGHALELPTLRNRSGSMSYIQYDVTEHVRWSIEQGHSVCQLRVCPAPR